MSSLGLFHLLVAITALITGAAVVVRPKGTRQHRQLGWVYVSSMLALNSSALAIYRLLGHFGPFHAFALISLASVSAGTISAVQARRARLARDPARRSTLVARHYQFMTWSYVGLCAAAVSEIATRVPAFRPAPGQRVVFGVVVAVATVIVMTGGGRLIVARRNRILAPFAARRAG